MGFKKKTKEFREITRGRIQKTLPRSSKLFSYAISGELKRKITDKKRKKRR